MKKKIKKIENEQVMISSNPSVSQWPPSTVKNCTQRFENGRFDQYGRFS